VKKYYENLMMALAPDEPLGGSWHYHPIN